VVSVHIQERAQSLLEGFLRNASVHLVALKPKGAMLDGLRALVERGQVRPHVDAVPPLTEVAAAHARLEAGGLKGKLVLDAAG
jgi:NADPH2:quinone reductase